VSNSRVSASRAGPYVTSTAWLRNLENSLAKLHKLTPVLGQKEGYSNVFLANCDEITARKVAVVITVSIVVT